MKRPNITAGEWSTAHEFPGCIIADPVEDSPRGKSAKIICRVQGSALPNYKTNLQFITAAPDMAKALEDCIQSLNRMPETEGAYKYTCISQAKAALIKAGYEFP